MVYHGAGLIKRLTIVPRTAITTTDPEHLLVAELGERNISQPEIVPFEDSIGAITGAHQRAGSHFGESQGQTPFAVLFEFIGVHPTGHGKVI